MCGLLAVLPILNTVLSFTLSALPVLFELLLTNPYVQICLTMAEFCHLC